MNDLLTKFLDDLERRVDDAEETALFKAWLDFAEGRFTGDVFAPARTRKYPAAITWPPLEVNAAMQNFDKMLLQQLLQCHMALEAGGGHILCMRPNYGTGILPSLFGADLFFMEDAQNTLPTAVPLEGGLATIKRLIRRGIPDVENGLGERTLEMTQRFSEALKAYPKLRRHVHLYHPDLQGPIDACELLWGANLFLDIVDHPALVKDFLELITETYIEFMRRWRQLVLPADGHSVHWCMLIKGHIMLRDDSAMNFSPAMYDEFIRPYDQRLLTVFEGGALHFCGRGDHYIASAGSLKGLHAVNLSQPHLNDMECIFRNTVDLGIKLLGLDSKFTRDTLSRGRLLHHSVHCWS